MVEIQLEFLFYFIYEFFNYNCIKRQDLTQN
jgi:hypothetical protein